MSVVRWETFQQLLDVFAAQEAANALQELARWWLTEKCKQMAAELNRSDYWLQPPALPSRLGGCWILVVNPDHRTHELLRPSFLFPLNWIPGQDDDPRLPAGVLKLANDVRNTLAGDVALGGQWGLQIYFESHPWNPAPENRGMDYPDFSELPAESFDFASGWASLAGSLLAAADNKASSADVWATGCWSPESGVTEVGGIEEKLALAQQHFSLLPTVERKNAYFVVPSDNIISANSAKARERYEFNIVAFPSPQVEPRLALGRYLALLKVKPRKDASVADHVAYYKAIFSDDRSVAEDYYQQVLYPLVVEQCRQSLGPIDPVPTHLVTVVSPNNELVRLAVEVFGIKRCLMLYTEPSDGSNYTQQISDLTGPAEAAADACRQLGCEVLLESFSYDATRPDFRSSLGKAFRAFFEQHFADVPPECVAIDMHGAFKIFNYTLEHAVAQRGNLFYWVDHQWFPGLRTQHPLTERFVVWRAGSDWISGPSLER